MSNVAVVGLLHNRGPAVEPPPATPTTEPPRRGRVEGLHETYRCFRAKDGWICVVCTSPDFYSRVLPRDGRAGAGRGSAVRGRAVGRARGSPAFERQLLEPRIRALTVAECLARFHEHDVPAQTVQDLAGFLESNLEAANELLVALGDALAMRFPAPLDAFRQLDIGAAPELGSTGELADLEWDARPPASWTAKLRAPLSGMRVLDFTTYLAGPICAAFLGDLGAEVIKVEPPAGEGLRSSGLS